MELNSEGTKMTSNSLLDYGRQLAAKRLAREGRKFPSHGLFEVVAKFENFRPTSTNISQFIWTIQDATPYAGDCHSWSFHDHVGENYYQTNKYSDGFETHCYSEDKLGSIDSIRFNRFSLNGEFYHLRTLADDDNQSHGKQNRKPYTGIDVDLPVIDVLASSVIAIRYWQTMSIDPEASRIAMSFRWTGLKGRKANAWIRYNDRWLFESSKEISEDIFETSVVIPTNLSAEEILPMVFPKLIPLYGLMLDSPVKLDSFIDTVKKYVIDRL